MELNECECRRCTELKFILKIKYNKRKNIALFKKIIQGS